MSKYIVGRLIDVWFPITRARYPARVIAVAKNQVTVRWEPTDPNYAPTYTFDIDDED